MSMLHYHLSVSFAPNMTFLLKLKLDFYGAVLVQGAMTPGMPIFSPMMPYGSGLTPQPVQNTNSLSILEEQQRQQQQAQQQQAQQANSGKTYAAFIFLSVIFSALCGEIIITSLQYWCLPFLFRENELNIIIHVLTIVNCYHHFVLQAFLERQGRRLSFSIHRLWQAQPPQHCQGIPHSTTTPH